MQGVYKIQNGINGRYYVGSSNDIEKRWQEHKWALGKGRHSNDRLQKSWNKHGKEVFGFKFIEKVKNKEDLHLIEQRYLDEGFEKDTLYNIAREAAGGRGPGWHHTEEAKAKMKKNRADLSGRNNPMYGRTHTESTKAKISKKVSGKKHPFYGKKRPTTGMLGRHHTEESKQKISDHWTPKRRKEKSEQMSGENNSFYGRRHTEETIAKIKESWTSERRKRESERVSGENNPMYGLVGKDTPRYGEHNTEEAKARTAKANAKPYPAFYNVKTGQFLPAGKTLNKLCREHNLRCNIMLSLKKGDAKESRSGWRLA